jgi:carboxypeptidase family protein
MLTLIALAAMLWDQAPAAAQPQPDPPPTAAIRGRVVAADTGQPLRRAVIQISQIDTSSGVPLANRVNRLASTDRDGTYEFTSLPAGRYNLIAMKAAFVRMAWGQEPAGTAGKPLDVLAGERVDHVDFALPRGGVITGRIVDESGEPLSGVRVSAVRAATVNGARQLGPTAGSSTNDLGEFRIFGIAPGQYLVQALWQRFGGGDPSSVDRTGYPLTFFPGTLSESEAQRFTVAAGRTIGDLVMTMSALKTARVEGQVVDSRGRPAGGVMLEMLSTVSGNNTMSSSPVRPDGTFVLASLAPGDYVLRTQPTPEHNEAALTKLTLSPGDEVKDLRLVMMPPGTISGRVVIDPSMAPPAAALSMIAWLDAQPMPGGARPARVNDDLTFEVVAWPGRNRVDALNLPPGWAVRTVRRDSVDVIDDGIEVAPGQTITGVDVELTTKIAVLSGAVTNARGEPAKDCSLVLFPTDSARWKVGSRYLRVARSDQDGRFKMAGVPPSDYYVVAVDKVEPAQWSDARFLEKMAPAARHVAIAEGETKTIDLKVTSGS